MRRDAMRFLGRGRAVPTRRPARFADGSGGRSSSVSCGSLTEPGSGDGSGATGPGGRAVAHRRGRPQSAVRPRADDERSAAQRGSRAGPESPGRLDPDARRPPAGRRTDRRRRRVRPIEPISGDLSRPPWAATVGGTGPARDPAAPRAGPQHVSGAAGVRCVAQICDRLPWDTARAAGISIRPGEKRPGRSIRGGRPADSESAASEDDAADPAHPHDRLI
jgi:hypothetical protein